MGASISQMNTQARERQEELARLKAQVPPGVNVDEGIPFKGSWIGSVLGVMIGFPVGIKRKSLNPLVYYGGTGAMLDVLFSVSDYEQQKEKRLREYVANLKNPNPDDGEDSEGTQHSDDDRAATVLED